jgi:hypothetical protein
VATGYTGRKTGTKKIQIEEICHTMFSNDTGGTSGTKSSESVQLTLLNVTLSGKTNER